jgi:hypothetical protein
MLEDHMETELPIDGNVRVDCSHSSVPGPRCNIVIYIVLT